MEDTTDRNVDGTTPFDDPPSTSAPPPPAEPPRPQRRLRRADRGPVGGVATGIADYLRVEPIIVQAVIIGLTIFGGSGFLLYLAAWLLIPTVDDPETAPLAISTTSAGRVLFGVIFAIGALSALFGAFSLGGGENVLVPLILIGGGFYLLNQRAENASTSPAPPAPMPPAPQGAHWAATRTEDDVFVEPIARAPKLPITSVTLAIAAMAAGLLLAVDQWTSADIRSGVVFGTSMAIVGAGLVFSAFRGRALPLVPVGLILALGLLVSPVFDASIDGGIGEKYPRPLNEADVLASYELGAGPLELDLRRVTFTEDRTIEVIVGAGYAEVALPTDVNVVVDGSSTAGYVEIFGRESAGIRSSSSASASALGVDDDTSRPTITIIAKVTFGYVEVTRG